jgi:hypothetical protein
MFRFEQRAQRRHADFARADKDNAHAELRHQLMRRRSAPSPPRGQGHQFVTSRHFSLPDRRSAASAKVIENFFVGQN